MKCRNCDILLADEKNFCPNCGERISAKRLTVKAIIATFFSNILSFDNKFAKTFKSLTFEPDKVIISYIDGFRKNYVNVISYLGLAITIIGLQFFVLRRFFPELLTASDFISTDNIKVNNKAFNFDSFLDGYYEYQGLLSVLFIPLYALASRALFFDSKKYNLAEHFVINIYTNAHFYIFWFLLVCVTLPLGINYNLLSQFAMIPMVIYMAYTFKRLYHIKFYDALARVILYIIIVLVVMIVILLIIGIIYGIYLGTTGQVQPMNIQ
ncbi:DUF3667 domain-containing protein [Psychroserpens sp. MEBiC05023]